MHLFYAFQVLQADGGNYTACVNAAMLALVDAGIPLKDTVVSCTASLVKNVPLVDVNHVEQSGGSPELVVSILPQSGEVRLDFKTCIIQEKQSNS